ncbi:class I SAM-dependent methyltransferase [Paenibacillus sp. IHBB 10380]|uniref:class I SAM-dependent methyltransferase n=1 Tax=Paenibacillus sp. IHBB 10380 TaxID=1566358 RepID=UPI0005CFA098|nr:class I SAM-dependent methyltransferase [Paenibacillus sp. IHBB 10380]AJS60447.1 hypothetical protein UB51_20555 [Paenibacillus sp. IHBB 10380]
MSDLNSFIHRNWDHPDVNKYEETIALKIPGYHLLYDMLDHLLTAQWGEQLSAHMLVVGAGGGQEIVTLGGKHKSWKFTGVDPSERMLDIASRRIEFAGLKDQVSLIHGELHELALDKLYDAGTCLLVHHFIEGLEQKKQLLQDIANRLHDGAPLFIAAINGDVTKESWSLQMNAWRSHMLDNGIPTEEWERFESSIGVASHPIPAVELEALLRDAGFSNVTRYFGSYLIDGWFAIKNGSVTS